MSEPERPDEPQADSVPEGGILAALPRARPQRASPRRTAARGRAGRSETAASTGETAATRKIAPAREAAPARKAAQARGTESAPQPVATGVPDARVARKAAPRARVGQAEKRRTTAAPKAKLSRAKPPEPPAPKQGYEPEEAVELGATVNPPSGAELVESAMDIVGELASSGLAAGGRLLKDAFTLWRRP